MRIFPQAIAFVFIAGVIFSCDETPDESVVISGKLNQWNTVILKFTGPFIGELDNKNPFLDYRLNVTFSNGKDTLIIPGFYAADGNAAETGADHGQIWMARFTPPVAGDWTYLASFREGRGIAVNDSINAGVPVAFNGVSGQFTIHPVDQMAEGFREDGRLNYVGKRYLQHTGSGKFFIKGGPDSPENFLAYEGFDNTPPKHKYDPHILDWREGDPAWKNGKGKGIIGALNYLESKGMNVVYFLTMNVMGDGDDVFPWTDRNERYRFDCSKLDQWEIVFEHFDHLGIVMHVVTQENENQVLLDAGFTDVQRKLYYREMVARFSHHLGVIWNMGEENGPANWFHNLGQSVQQRKDMVRYLRKIDPYNNLIVFHTQPSNPQRGDYLEPFLGDEHVDGVSLQISDVYEIHDEVKKWVEISADSGRQWVVNMDEIGPYYRGLVNDIEDPAHDTIRVQALWGTLLAGGAGTEWYFGPEDLSAEDFRSRNNMWDQTRIAMEFFTHEIPFTDMSSMDELILSGDAWCFAKRDEVYVIYLIKGGMASVDLSSLNGKASLSWFNPRLGKMETGSSTIEAGTSIVVGPPPSETNHDWVAVIRKIP